MFYNKEKENIKPQTN